MSRFFDWLFAREPPSKIGRRVILLRTMMMPAYGWPPGDKKVIMRGAIGKVVAEFDGYYKVDFYDHGKRLAYEWLSENIDFVWTK